VYQHLAVGLGSEGMTGSDQFSAKIHKIVDLTVEDRDYRFVLVKDGLPSLLGEVDDAQPAKAKGNFIIQIAARHVGPAVDDTVHHIVQNLLSAVDYSAEADKTTHRLISSFFSVIGHTITVYHYITEEEKNKEGRHFFFKFAPKQPAIASNRSRKDLRKAEKCGIIILS
jgi:hypothetical protein